jgi:hypothetical protein
MKITIKTEDMACAKFIGFGAEWDSRNYRDAGITEADFALIRRRVEWMRLPAARIMMQMKWCRREDGSFDFETPPMQDLYRHLDVCEALGTTVFLADWGCMPAWLRAPGIGDVADPLYAESIGVYLEHLVNVKRYSCIRYFIMVNEPNWEVKDFALWRRGLEQVARELKRRGLDRQIQLAGSDEAHAQEDDWHFQAVDRARHLLGAYDVHRYVDDAGEVRAGQLTDYFRRLWDYARLHDPEAARKPCMIGEAGLRDGWHPPATNDLIGTFEYGLVMADYAVQAANAETAAVLAWMLDDNSHAGFLWGLWTSKADGLRLRPWFYPWALLSRLFPAGCAIHPVSTGSPDLRVLVARTADGWAVCAVNRGDQEIECELALGEEARPLQVMTYLYSADNAPVDAEGLPVPVAITREPQQATPVIGPPRSVTFCQISAQSQPAVIGGESTGAEA